MAKKTPPPSPPPQKANLPAVEPQLEEIRGEVERKVGPLLQGREREQILSRLVSIVVEETFRGPLPHPRHLQAYEAISPGAADRIIKMAEKVNDHNVDVSKTEQAFDHAYKNKGLFLGFAALLALITAAVFCGLYGQPTLAGGFIAAGALGVVGKFIHAHVTKGPSGTG